MDSENICQAVAMNPDSYTFDKFRYMSILSGCDYVDPLPGMAQLDARKFILVTKEENPEFVSI